MTEELPEPLKKQLVEMGRLAMAGRLAADFSHQINNALGGIMGYTSMILEEMPDAAPAKRKLQIVVREALAVSKLVQSLMDVSMQQEPGRHRVDVAETVRAVVALLSHRAAKSGARVEECYEDGLLVQVVKVRLAQAIFNLLCYSICAAHGGEIRVKIWGEDAWVRISISSPTCCSLKPDAVFDLFDVCGANSSGVLSLFVCREVVRGEGGDVIWELSPENKITFIASLPRAV